MHCSIDLLLIAVVAITNIECHLAFFSPTTNSVPGRSVLAEVELNRNSIQRRSMSRFFFFLLSQLLLATEEVSEPLSLLVPTPYLSDPASPKGLLIMVNSF